jgi:hypothetical protein
LTIQAAICLDFGWLLLSIVALADCSCEDSAISQKVKHKEPDGGLHSPTRDFFFKVSFFEHVKLLQVALKKARQFFFAQTHLKDLIKLCYKFKSIH